MIAPLLIAACALAAEVAAPRAPNALDSEGAAFVGSSIDFSLAVPANGATMPKNARLLAFGQFFDDTGKSDRVATAEIVFRRVRDDGSTTELAHSEAPGTSFEGRAYFVELGDLVAGETVSVTCDRCFDTWSATVIDDVDEEPPAFQIGNKNRIDVTDMGAGVGYQVRACIPAPIDAAGGKVALRVITDVEDSYGPAIQGAGNGFGGCGIEEVDVTAFAEGNERMFCFQTLAVDASGNESLFHETICAALPVHAPEGCSQGSGAPFAFALGALLVSGRRRAARTCLRRAP